jgi:phosphoglycolate phosphatase
MHILFDLDGTLTDSRPGIVRCLQHALTGLGCEPPPEPELVRCIGPPLASGFEKLLATTSPVLIERALTAYRERYEEIGMFESALYPGVQKAITALATLDHALYVVTSKPAVYARRVLEHFHINGIFTGIYGPELTDRQYTKGSLIHTALENHGIDRTAAVMIGDRAEDIMGARQNNLASVGVTWGYGSREELNTAAPDCIVESVAALMEYIERTGARL